MFGSRDSGDGLRRSTSTFIDGGGGDLLDLTGAWRLRMLVMEKSVDDALHADFVGSAGFSDGWISAEGGIASAATVEGGDCDVERNSSTDDGDIGELINFLFVVVVAGSSIESQHTVDCMLNYHAVVHFSADELICKLRKNFYSVSVYVIVKQDYNNRQHGALHDRSFNGDCASSSCFIWRERAPMFCRLGWRDAAKHRRTGRCPSTRRLAAPLVACRFQAGALCAPLDWRCSVARRVINQLAIMSLSSSSSNSSSSSVYQLVEKMLC